MALALTWLRLTVEGLDRTLVGHAPHPFKNWSETDWARAAIKSGIAMGAGKSAIVTPYTARDGASLTHGVTGFIYIGAADTDLPGYALQWALPAANRHAADLLAIELRARIAGKSDVLTRLMLHIANTPRDASRDQQRTLAHLLQRPVAAKPVKPAADVNRDAFWLRILASTKPQRILATA